MQKTKKILVPIDFSPCSENALAYAIQLAVKIKAAVRVLNVTKVDTGETENPYMAEKVIEEKIGTVKQSIDKSLITVKENVSRFLDELPTIETIVEFGSANSMISDVAKRDQVDFIIMGTQGENSMSDRFLGSTASITVKYTPCPLVVIPEGASFQSSVIMGYASNLNSSDPFEIWKASEMMKPLPIVAVHWVHFSEKQKEWNDKLDTFKAFFSANAPSLKINFYSFSSDDMVNDLNHFCNKHKINLMVMYRPSRNFWQALLQESFTQEMSKHINVPLLILIEGSR